jgi:hypothetical protein
LLVAALTLVLLAGGRETGGNLTSSIVLIVAAGEGMGVDSGAVFVDDEESGPGALMMLVLKPDGSAGDNLGSWYLKPEQDPKPS